MGYACVIDFLKQGHEPLSIYNLKLNLQLYIPNLVSIAFIDTRKTAALGVVSLALLGSAVIWETAASGGGKRTES